VWLAQGMAAEILFYLKNKKDCSVQPDLFLAKVVGGQKQVAPKFY
jgi:hypothetical protein